MSALKTSSFCLALLFLTGEFAAAANPQGGEITAAGRYFGGRPSSPGPRHTGPTIHLIVKVLHGTCVEAAHLALGLMIGHFGPGALTTLIFR